MIVLRFLWPLLFIISAGRIYADPKHSGESLYSLCQSCHGTKGEGRADLEAPAIAGLPQWYIERTLKKFQNGARGAHADDIAGQRMRPMARVLRYEGDIPAVAKYVASLPVSAKSDKVVGNPMKGEKLFQTCIACHGANAEGNQQLDAPPLAIQSPWYLFSQIKKFQSKIRGSDSNKDPQGAVMAPLASTLGDDQAIHDVISYIKTLK